MQATPNLVPLFSTKDDKIIWPSTSEELKAVRDDISLIRNIFHHFVNAHKTSNVIYYDSNHSKAFLCNEETFKERKAKMKQTASESAKKWIYESEKPVINNFTSSANICYFALKELEKQSKEYIEGHTATISPEQIASKFTVVKNELILAMSLKHLGPEKGAEFFNSYIFPNQMITGKDVSDFKEKLYQSNQRSTANIQDAPTIPLPPSIIVPKMLPTLRTTPRASVDVPSGNTTPSIITPTKKQPSTGPRATPRTSAPTAPKIDQFLLADFLEDFNKSDATWAQTFTKLGPRAFDFRELYRGVTADFSRDLNSILWQQLISLIGHEWQIEMNMQLNGEPISTSGYSTHYALGRLASSVYAFKEKFPDLHIPLANEILEALRLGPLHHCCEDQAEDICKKVLEQNLPAIIGTGWDAHSTSIVLLNTPQDGLILAYINRGSRAIGKGSGITFYKVNNRDALTPELIKRLQRVQKMTYGSEQGKIFLEEKGVDSLHTILKLEQIGFMEMKDQDFGTCTWSSACGAFLALLNLAQRHQSKTPHQSFKEFLKSEESKEVKELYKLWKSFDRQEQLGALLYIHRACTDISMRISEAKVSPPLHNKDHYRLTAAVIYKMIRTNKKGRTYNNHQIKRVIDENRKLIMDMIKDHIKFHNYFISDCLHMHSRVAAEKFMKYMPNGAFYIRERPNKTIDKNFEAITIKIDDNIVNYGLQATGEKDSMCGEECYQLVDDEGPQSHSFSSLQELLQILNAKHPSLKAIYPVYPDIEKIRIDINNLPMSSLAATTAFSPIPRNNSLYWKG